MNTQFSYRNLTQLEAEQLRLAVQDSPNITGYTTNELTHFSNTIVASVDNQLAGVCISITLPRHWTDIALLYVFKEFRNQGIGSHLLEKAWESAQEKQNNVYIVSRNPTVIRTMQKHGMQFLSLLQLPLPIQLYNVGFILSIYRIRETFRKTLLSKELPPFQYAIKKFTETR